MYHDWKQWYLGKYSFLFKIDVYHLDPLGVETLKPRLSWQFHSTQRNILQTAYRILVADNPSSLNNSISNVWDTKKKYSDASIQIQYNGATLQPTKVYYWSCYNSER